MLVKSGRASWLEWQSMLVKSGRASWLEWQSKLVRVAEHAGGSGEACW